MVIFPIYITKGLIKIEYINEWILVVETNINPLYNIYNTYGLTYTKNTEMITNSFSVHICWINAKIDLCMQIYHQN